MSSFVPRNAETLADRARYTAEGLTTVSCMDCLVSVQVRKNSDHQTAIQWTAGGQQECPVLAKRAAGAIHEGCPRLMASIDAAVRSGALLIGAAE